MTGIVYYNLDNKIIAIIKDVQSYTFNNIIGKGNSVSGIDLNLANFCIVESTNLQVGDILGSFIDIREQLIPTQEERLTAVESAIIALMGV